MNKIITVDGKVVITDNKAIIAEGSQKLMITSATASVIEVNIYSGSANVILPYRYVTTEATGTVA